MNSGRDGQFATTRWSLILEAGHGNAPESREALDSLCTAYWFPLYAFARKNGFSPDDSADLTQEFFSTLIEQSLLQSADPLRGRFRSWLRTLFQRFLSDERERRHTIKRGGHLRRLPQDCQEAEQRYERVFSDARTAERMFEREWALTVLQRVIRQLQEDYTAKGKSQIFDRCQSFLTGSAATGEYPVAAAALAMSEGALRVAVHRMRERYRELLRQEVAGTVANAAEIDDELTLLRRALQPDQP